MCQPRAKFTRTSHFKGSYSDHCWPEASFLPSSFSRLPHFPPITDTLGCGGILSLLNYLSSYLFLAVVTLDEPGNGSLWRARNTLQEGAVVLRRIHHPVVHHIKLFWLKERWRERFLVWRALHQTSLLVWGRLSLLTANHVSSTFNIKMLAELTIKTGNGRKHIFQNIKLFLEGYNFQIPQVILLSCNPPPNTGDVGL